MLLFADRLSFDGPNVSVILILIGLFVLFYIDLFTGSLNIMFSLL